jgi:acetyl esterase/lipase
MPTSIWHTFHSARHDRIAMQRTALLMAALITLGCAQHSVSNGSRADTTADTWEFERLEPLVYTPSDWPEALTATVYRPKRAGPMPAVLVVHGGGWSRRSPADMERISRSLATHGFVAVNVAYRLAPAYRYPAPLHDLQQALDWMVDNAESLQIDPDRMGAFGYSAGAHLVSLLAVVESRSNPHPQPIERGHRLKAVVAGGTPADLTQWPDSPLVNRFLGESYASNPERWREASPITHVSTSTPPFFLYHGGLDLLVEVAQAHAMKDRLDAAGVRAELYTVPYHGHFSMFVMNRSAVRRGAAFLQQMLQ